MLRFNRDGNKFNIVLVNEALLIETIITKVTMIIGSTIEDNVSRVFKNKVFDAVLEAIILEAFLKADINIEVNQPYLLNLVLKDETYSYMLSNLKHDEVSQGYMIAKTLQV